MYNRGQFHRATKQRILLSNIKQTTGQDVYILYKGVAGNQINLLNKSFWQALYNRGQFHRATCTNQRILLSNIKQTTGQDVYILYKGVAGNQINLLNKSFWQALYNRGQFHRATCTKQRILLSNIKQTTGQDVHYTFCIKVWLVTK